MFLWSSEIIRVMTSLNLLEMLDGGQKRITSRYSCIFRPAFGCKYTTGIAALKKDSVFQPSRVQEEFSNKIAQNCQKWKSQLLILRITSIQPWWLSGLIRLFLIQVEMVG